MSAVQPGELAYHKASEGTTLADWLFKLEQLLSQLGVGSGGPLPGPRLQWRVWRALSRGAEPPVPLPGIELAAFPPTVRALQGERRHPRPRS